eukprot:NODE_306_length_11344_cov_0.675767.p3 type:complete len:613 gc:universal NODE_306_length_11344_cov_0.675767:5024-3186(-)
MSELEFEIIEKDIKLAAVYNKEYTQISVIPPNNLVRQLGADIVACVDVSGSMGSAAEIKTGTGSESSGLNILDVVKHALKTIAKSLTKLDSFSLVSFDDRATLILDHCSDKDMIISSIENLCLGGSTNLYDGLITGLGVLKKSDSLNKSLFILTDGLPNVSPPRGELQAFKQYIDTENLNCTVNTFGFGYNLDSKLLYDLAVLGNGSFSFIPDSSMVGTIFINSIAACFTTIAQHCVVDITTSDTIWDPICLNNYAIKNSWGYKCNMGSIISGQSKSVLIKGKISNATLHFDNKSISCTATATDASFEDLARLITVKAIFQSYSLCKQSDYDGALRSLKSAISEINQLHSSEMVTGLLKDLNGQVHQAISRADWFTKWGQHYLLSLHLAHSNQITNNFKDPGVQIYSHTLFKQLQNEIEQVFLKLPPPKPSSSSNVSTVSMSNYYNSGNPCFCGDGVVKLMDSFKLVRELAKGDVLDNGAVIECIVRTKIESYVEMVDVGFFITPYHPIFIHGKWEFPLKIGPIQSVYCSFIYSLVLDKVHIITINDRKCITLGHLVNHGIAKHEYFGDLIIEDLKMLSGYSEGLITMSSNWLRRENGKVIGIEPGSVAVSK